MLYVLEVGRQTRAGIEVMVRRYINTQNTRVSLHNRFAREYVGLSVKVIEAENIESIPLETDNKPDNKPETVERITYLKDIKVSLNESELLLRKEMMAKVEEANKFRNQIQGSVAKRYRAQNNVSTVNGVETCLETGETTIERVFLHSSVYIESIMKGEA